MCVYICYSSESDWVRQGQELHCSPAGWWEQVTSSICSIYLELSNVEESSHLTSQLSRGPHPILSDIICISVTLIRS